MGKKSKEKDSYKHTDVLFLIIFVCFLAGLALIWGIGVARGDARRLVYPLDSEGNMCGVDNTQAGGRDLQAKPFLAWFDPRDYSSQICVPLCLSDAGPDDQLAEYFEVYTSSVSVPYRRYPDFEVLRRCLPENLHNADSKFQNFLNGNSGAHFFNDLEDGYWLLLIALPFTVLLCVLHLFFLRVFANEMIWVTVFISLGLITGASVYCILQGSGVIETHSSHFSLDLLSANQHNIFIVGILLAVLDFCVLVTVCLFGSKIGLVGAMMEETGHVLTQMPSIVLFPVVPLLLAIAFVVIWCVFTMYLLSAHSIDLSKEASNQLTQNRIGDMDDSLKFGLIYNGVALLWVTFYILAWTKVTIAGGVTTWYFSKDKARIDSGIIYRFFTNTFWYQSGSLALGSLLITLTFLAKWVTRVLLWIISRETKYTIVRWILMCIAWFVECVLKVIGMISHYSYIEMALSGDSFFVSARRVSGLLQRNVTKIAVVDLVGDFVLLLCKLNVTFMTGYGLTLLLKTDAVAGLDLWEPESLVILSMVIAFPVASCFFGIYEMGIDSILICFCNEVEVGLEVFMSKRLKDFIDQNERLVERPNSNKNNGRTSKTPK